MWKRNRNTWNFFLNNRSPELWRVFVESRTNGNILSKYGKLAHFCEGRNTCVAAPKGVCSKCGEKLPPIVELAFMFETGYKIWDA